MTEPKAPPGKPVRVDALLASWPAATRPGVEWDEAAERVVACIAEDEDAGNAAFSAVSDEDSLSAPLPPEPGEVQSSAPIGRASEGAGMSTTSRERERDRNALRDSAKLANMTPPPSSATASSGPVSSTVPTGHATKEDSGVINLAALAASEGQAHALQGSGRPGSRRGHAHAALGHGASPCSGGPALHVQGALPRAAQAEPLGDHRRDGRRGSRRGRRLLRPPEDAARGSPCPRGSVPVSPAQATTAAPPAAGPTPVATIAPADRGVDPSTLPAAGMGPRSGPAWGLHPRRSPPEQPAPRPPPRRSPPSSRPCPRRAPPRGQPEPAVADAAGRGRHFEPHGRHGHGRHDGPPRPRERPPPALPGGHPGGARGRPSLRAQLPRARRPDSRATITFASDGSVQSVSISGGAAGKPAEACIRSALSRARVSPFAQPTFTASTTVRPN